MNFDVAGSDTLFHNFVPVIARSSEEGAIILREPREVTIVKWSSELDERMV